MKIKKGCKGEVSLSQFRGTHVGQQQVSFLVFWTAAPLLHRRNQQEVIITVSLRRISLKCSGQKLWTITSAGSGRCSQDKQLHTPPSSLLEVHKSPVLELAGFQSCCSTLNEDPRRTGSSRGRQESHRRFYTQGQQV